MSLRSHVMKMSRDTEQDVTIRTFQTLMVILDDHYAMTAREQDMAEMDKLFSPKRENQLKQRRLSGRGSTHSYRTWKVAPRLWRSI